MPKQQPNNVRKIVQNGTKLAPSWGHVVLPNRPGRVQGRKKRLPEAIRKEDQKKHPKTSVWEAPRREVPGGGLG